MRLCYRYEEGIHTKEKKGISIVERREERGARVYGGVIEKELH